MKRGQTTLFIILGIIIVAVIALFLFYSGDIFEQTATKELTEVTDITDIQTVVDDCVKNTAEAAVYFVGMQGGYAVLPEDSLILEDGTAAPYVYDKGENKLQSIENMEAEISSFIDETLEACSAFESMKQFTITSQKPTTTTEIQENKIITKTEFSVTVKSEGTERNLEKDYGTTVEVRLGAIREAVNKVIEKTAESPESVNIDFLLDLDFDFNVLPVEGGSMLYVLKDEQSMIQDEPFEFLFAHRFEDVK